MTTQLSTILRRHRYKKRLYCFWLMCLFGAIALVWDNTPGIHGYNLEIPLSPNGFSKFSDHPGGRSLLQFGSLENCTPPAIEQFPYPLMDKETRQKGGVTVHILIAAYMFLALAIACDEYFVPACEKVCDVLDLQSDVAGATFMAAGSSAPELATSIIAVFIAKDDIGLGAVVGSAVFNIMFVISVCALFAGMVVYLNWWPMFRDSLFYTISILALVAVIVDDLVQWYEALVLLILYVVYIVIMLFNPRLEAFFVPKFSCCGYVKAEDRTELTPVVDESSSPSNHKTFDLPQAAEESESEKETDVHVKTHLEESEDESPFTPPAGCCKRFLWVISLPLIAVMYVTVPDCRKERWARWWWMTFLMSCAWIALFSYLMVWMITIIGSTFEFPDTIMSMTFIAAGASVPDAIASLLVSQDGLGDMAVSNAIGSNVFDILLCLGLPYFLKCTIVNAGEPVEVYSQGLTYSSLTLLTTVLFLLVSIHLNGWKLDIKYGVILMVVYFLFNILAILYELNVFGYVHPPECPTTM